MECLSVDSADQTVHEIIKCKISGVLIALMQIDWAINKWTIYIDYT